MRKSRKRTENGMKRGLDACQDGVGSSMTPSKSASRRIAPPLKSISKKPKQGSIRRFCVPSGGQDVRLTTPAQSQRAKLLMLCPNLCT
eukprot:350874-Chlamydomonas_euryale.AAC.10